MGPGLPSQIVWNISLADVKRILEGRAVEDGSWLILRHVQLESHVDALKKMPCRALCR